MTCGRNVNVSFEGREGHRVIDRRPTIGKSDGGFL